MVRTCKGMLNRNTPIEDWREHYGLYVKREDLACPPPGPPFSKTRGVFVWVGKQQADIIGVLDTYHSQAGHAVARACQLLGKKCLNFYPEYKGETGLRPPQLRAKELGAELKPLPAGRSCILYHQAVKETKRRGGVTIPNALKLPESVEETAKEVPERVFSNVLLPSSSGTIAAGVIRGFCRYGLIPRFIVHLGYSRSHGEVLRYLSEASGVEHQYLNIDIIDEGYSYKDRAKDGPTPEWPCNAYYDLKAFRWWLREGREQYGEALLWNVG